MKAFGSKRTYHDCRVYRAGHGKKILFTVGVKSKKQVENLTRKIDMKRSGKR